MQSAVKRLESKNSQQNEQVQLEFDFQPDFSGNQLSFEIEYENTEIHKPSCSYRGEPLGRLILAQEVGGSSQGQGL